MGICDSSNAHRQDERQQPKNAVKVSQLPPDQKALMDCYDKRIEYATDSIYAYDRTGEDRTASLIITKGDKEAADAAYQKFRDIADNL